MCAGIDASVPMPFFSMSDIRSLSERYGGGDVCDVVNSTPAIASFAPGVSSGRGSSSIARHGIIFVHPGSITLCPTTANPSPPHANDARWTSYAQSGDNDAMKCRAMKSYRRHASPPPTRSEVAERVGAIGGWSPSSFPPRGRVIAPPSRSSATCSPHAGWCLCALSVPLRSKPGGYAVLSVRGYEMNPEMYSRSATCIAACAPMPKPADAAFNISTVFKPLGLGRFSSVRVNAVSATPFARASSTTSLLNSSAASRSNTLSRFQRNATTSSVSVDRAVTHSTQ